MPLTSYLFFLICDHLCIPCLADNLSFSSFMPITFEIVHMHIYAKYSMAITWQPQIFYICKPYFFLHIFVPSCISCLVVIFVLFFPQIPIEVFTAIHKYFTFMSYIWSLIYNGNFCISCLVTHFLFLNYACNVWNYIYMYIYTQHTYTY